MSMLYGAYLNEWQFSTIHFQGPNKYNNLTPVKEIQLFEMEKDLFGQ